MIEKGITIGGKKLQEHLEATNHAKAFDWVIQFVQGNPAFITEKDILTIHDIVLKGIDDDHNAGHYRAIAARLFGSMTILPNYAKVPDLMAQYVIVLICIQWSLQRKRIINW